MPERIVSCYGCGRSHTFTGGVPRSAVCDDCAGNLRCCLGCRFHDTQAYNECAEPSAERVVDKAAANFCDYFDPAVGRTEVGRAGPSPASGDLEKLFKK